MSYLQKFAFLVFLFLGACSKNDNEYGIVGMKYIDARPIILNNGWKPFDMGSSSIDPLEREFTEIGYVEVEECAGTGVSPCVFYFQNTQGKYLEIVTQGETIDSAYVRYSGKLDELDKR